MLPNEVFALECLARYAKEGLDVKQGGVHDGYPDEFAHCPTPRPKGQKDKLAGDLGYYLTFFDHQHQGLLQSVDVGRKCYYNQKVKLYLDTWPPGCFELWDIYDEFNKHTEEAKEKISEANSGRTQTEAQKKAHSERMSGEKHPNYGNTGALSPASKAIIVIKPDGTKLYFAGGSEAGRALGVSQGNISLYARREGPVRAGQFKDWEFSFTQ